MKCQNCGKNEINFHYSSNVNGCVTETHLCSECAEKSGYDLGSLFDIGSIFGGFGEFSGFGGNLPLNTFAGVRPVPVAELGFPRVFKTWVPRALPQESCECGACEAPVQQHQTSEVDEEMQKRREINMLKEQMRQAANNDDFEKAAQLRDQVKQMEEG